MPGILDRAARDLRRLRHLAADLRDRGGQLVRRGRDRLDVGAGLLRRRRDRDRAGVGLLRDGRHGFGRRPHLGGGGGQRLDERADLALERPGQRLHLLRPLLACVPLRGALALEAHALDAVLLEDLHRLRHLADLVLAAEIRHVDRVVLLG